MPVRCSCSAGVHAAGRTRRRADPGARVQRPAAPWPAGTARRTDGSQSVARGAVLAGAGQADRPRDDPTATLTFERATELGTILGDAGGRAQALYGTPEYQAPRAVRPR